MGKFTPSLCADVCGYGHILLMKHSNADSGGIQVVIEFSAAEQYSRLCFFMSFFWFVLFSFSNCVQLRC